MSPVAPIRLDPFFDGPAMPDNGGQPNVITLTRGNDLTGPTLSEADVVPHAMPGRGGGQVGARPHDVRDLVLHIDPHIAGQSSSVRLGAITTELAREGAEQAARATPDPYDLPTLRLRGAAAMHMIAAQAAAAIPAQAAAAVAAQVAPSRGRVVDTRPTTPPQAPVIPRRQISPLTAFDRLGGQRGGRRLDLTGPPPAGVHPSTPPQRLIEVVFEVEHFGSQTAFYTDVIIQETFIVLIFSNGGQVPKYFPQPSREESPRMAMHVVGTTDIYIVKATDRRYSYDGAEFCLLDVISVQRLPEGEES